MVDITCSNMMSRISDAFSHIVQRAQENIAVKGLIDVAMRKVMLITKW